MDLGGIDRMAGESGFNTSWDDPRGPATYGDKGNMTYDQWMQSLGYEKGSYGPADDGYKRFVEGGGGWIKNPKTDLGKTEVALGQQGAIAEVENSKINKAVDQTNNKQESNDNEITNNYEKPADYGWITGGEVKEDQEDGYDLDTYIFSKNMLSGNRLDDAGNPMGFYGAMETPSSLKADAEERLKYTKKSSPKYKEIQSKIEKYDKAIAAYQKYVDAYKDRYEADENKNKYVDFDKSTDPADADLEKQYKRSQDKITDFYVKRSELEGKAYDTRDKILVGHEWAPDKESYDEEPSEYEGWIDSDKEEYGSGNVYNYTGSDDDFAAKVNAANNAWDQVALIEKNIADAERIINEYPEKRQERAAALQQSVMDDYAAGKLTPFEAANKLANIHNAKIDFGMSAISSRIDPDTDIMGKIGGREEVSKAALETELADVTSPSMIEQIQKIENLAELRTMIDNVDVSQIKDEKQFGETVDFVNAATSQYTKVANTELEKLITEIAKDGGDLQRLREDGRFIELTQNVYEDAQSAFDKVSELEKYTEKFGLNEYGSKREVKKAQVEISQKIAKIQNDFESKAVGSYYSPGSDMGGIQATGVSNMTKEDIKAFANYTKSITCTKDALVALMKSAAFNGAEDVKGGEYSEAWKNEPAIKTDKSLKGGLKANDSTTLTWKDWVSASAKGLAGTVATIAGAGAMAVNPLVGGVILAAGLGITGKAGLDMTTKITGAHSTNREKTFAQQGTGVEKTNADDFANIFHIGAAGNKVTAKDVINDIGNRTTEQANIGDEKSVGTYTKTAGGFAEAVSGFVLLSTGNILGVLPIIDGVREMKSGLQGGLENNLDAAIQNIYQLATSVDTWAHANLDIDKLMNDPNAASNLMSSATPKDQVIGRRNANDAALSSFGTASVNADADNKYSGYREEAKNKNLATDYNAGMEENINEAVSSKYVKIFKVMLDKEPDYIRKVLIAIPKNHSEHEWK